MRILGIDPGLKLTGYGCIDCVDGRAEPVVVEAGVLRLKSNESVAYRVTQLYEDLCQTIEELKPQVMGVEKLFAHYRHPRTSVIMGHARGVILLAAHQGSIEIEELAATEVKKSITGNGHAGKAQIQRAIMSLCQLHELPTPPDVADALALAICAARRRASAQLSQG